MRRGHRPRSAGPALAGLALIAAALLGGCAGPEPSGALQPRPLKVVDFAKTDIDSVAEVHRAQALAHLEALMLKLYRRNPREWRRAGHPSAEFMVARVFRGTRVPDFVELGGRRGVDAVRLAFEEGYRGDRVLAFVAGLAAMVQRAYDDKVEFFVLDELDPQKLYNSARNVEIAAWKLGNDRDGEGRLFLLSNSMDEGVPNISYERLIGKLVGRQDMIAELIADRSNRTIRHVVQSMASAVFLPI